MPPPDKFDERWFLIAAVVLAVLCFVVVVALFQ